MYTRDFVIDRKPAVIPLAKRRLGEEIFQPVRAVRPALLTLSSKRAESAEPRDCGRPPRLFH